MISIIVFIPRKIFVHAEKWQQRLLSPFFLFSTLMSIVIAHITRIEWDLASECWASRKNRFYCCCSCTWIHLGLRENNCTVGSLNAYCHLLTLEIATNALSARTNPKQKCSCITQLIAGLTFNHAYFIVFFLSPKK